MSTKWGILSAGKISHDFAVAFEAGLNKDEHEMVAVSARNLKSAQDFAKEHSIPRAYGSYEEFFKDPQIDVVYIGSIIPTHLDLAKAALAAGKHVLCEKPLCINVKQTKELLEFAKERKLFLMEAIWSRFFPVFKKLKEDVDQGKIGEVIQVVATFGVEIHEVDRVKLKELGGGTILDIGIYCVQFASLIFGGVRPLKIIAGGFLNSEGVDQSTSTTLIYPGGKTATLVTHSKATFPNEAFAIGTKGTLKILSPFWCGTKLESEGQTINFPLPHSDKIMNYSNSTGLSYQCNEVRRCIQNGLLESPVMSHEESLIIAEIMESVRKQLGVVYPQD